MPSEAQIKFVPTTRPTALAACADGHRSAPDLCRMAFTLSHPGYDVLLFPTIYSYVPVWSKAKKIIIVHDVIPEKYPEMTLPKLGPRFLWKAKAAWGRSQADAIVTVSEFSRAAIVEHFRIPENRVFVVSEASDSQFRVIDRPLFPAALETLGLKPGNRLVAYVGGFGPHKNVTGLVDAFARVTGSGEFGDARLLLVGNYYKEVFHSGVAAIRDRIRERSIERAVVFTGFLPDETLAHVLNLSTCLVLPSLMEGFGLPAIEAAACGCPVIATTASPLPGLLGDAGLYFDPHDTKALEDALRMVLQSEALRAQMRERGLAAAAKLSWDAAARQMIALIQKVN
jgi:glycosyltransferase involved in cell wall biosynthesis